MSKVTAGVDFDKVPEDELTRYLSIFGAAVLQAINGGLDFSTNFNGKIVSVTFSSANNDTAVSHGLGRAPVGYIPVRLGAAMTLYDGTMANTTSLLYLKSSATGSASVFIF
jgi:hypothetical protein